MKPRLGIVTSSSIRSFRASRTILTQGRLVINYQPFLVRPADLRLMTGLSAAWFEYLDLYPKKGTGAGEKGTDPIWRQHWMEHG